MATKKKSAKKAAPKKTARKPAKSARKVVKKAAKRAVPRAKAAARPKDNRKKPETIRIGASMPSFTVSNLQLSLAFYRDVLGLVVADEWKQGDVLMGVSLKAGKAEFMIGQDDFAKGRDRQKGIGFRLYCTTTQNVDQLAAGIEARGGTLDSQPADQPWGSRDFSVTDPDGFKLTIGREK
ncbi:MAG: VOC family protein [Gemmatimonadota bacterium]